MQEKFQNFRDIQLLDSSQSIKKISQDISKKILEYIPLVPFDRIWTDDKVCEYLKIEKHLYI